MNRREHPETQETVDVDAEEMRFLEINAPRYGVTVRRLDARGIDVLQYAMVSIAGSTVAVSTLLRLLNEFRGGQVIDMQAPASRRVYRSRSLEYGLVAIIAKDGTVTLSASSKRGGIEQVLALLAALKATHGADLPVSTIKAALATTAGEADAPPSEDRG
ncbi:hypothetical protein [Actinomycetospora chiangmaiensis]|uniref:hypothetical protein n=1 Tax=Actinomycetospora chiangmaiensis TaxID=402650 RepID=UPI0012F8C1F2|nr:hypothetical protein [Actinomycetospora chiangmaiensis]